MTKALMMIATAVAVLVPAVQSGLAVEASLAILFASFLALCAMVPMPE